MEFFTVSKYKRPVRLCEATRKFAFDSLNHVYGLATDRNLCVEMDDIEGFDSLPALDRYDMSIRRIVENAPIRICPDEKLSGAASFGMSIRHEIPASIRGETVFASISHITVDFDTVLRKGINGIRKDVLASLEKHTCGREKRFLESCISVLDSMKIWHGRYIDALTGKKGYEANLENLKRVPFEPANGFYEAVQSLWFTFAFLRLCGNWPGFGRLDVMLGDYLRKDLASGALTLDEAREILAHFFIKGCEWVKGGEYYGGDAQHYQNIVLAGTDGDGNEVTNEVTYLVLDIIEELGISDFPTTLRLNSGTDEKLLRRAAEVLRFGGGILAFYDEETIIKTLIRYGYPESDAWRFANDGCWEIQIPGKTYFTYTPFDALQILQKNTLGEYSDSVSFDSFGELYDKFISDLKAHVEGIFNYKQRFFTEEDKFTFSEQMPCTAVSLFEQGCIEKGKSYLEGGPVYNVDSPHIGGFPDVVNSLYAIKKLVFDEKKLSFGEFMKILENDWEGEEALRRAVLNGYTYYGNDNDECDMIGAAILKDFGAICRALDGKCGLNFPAGLSTFGRQLQWAPARLTSAHGHKKGEVLAPNCSPTPGSDRAGATAIIKSYCKADLCDMVTGAALDIKLLPTSVEGDDGIDAIVALLRGFVALGGCFVQPDVEDSEILKEAQAHPENYQTLSVRVSGWNARFVTLSKEWQDMVINENK